MPFSVSRPARDFFSSPPPEGLLTRESLSYSNVRESLIVGSKADRSPLSSAEGMNYGSTISITPIYLHVFQTNFIFDQQQHKTVTYISVPLIIWKLGVIYTNIV